MHSKMTICKRNNDVNCMIERRDIFVDVIEQTMINREEYQGLQRMIYLNEEMIHYMQPNVIKHNVDVMRYDIHVIYNGFALFVISFGF